MRIAFDAKRAFMNSSGLGNYSRTLIRNLLKYQEDLEFLLLSPDSGKKAKQEFLSTDLERVSLHENAGLRRLYASAAWFRDAQVDLYHGLSNELPLNSFRLPVKKVVSIHDLIFIRYPNWYKTVDRAIYAYKTRKACQHADRIIAISEQTKSDLQEFLSIPEQRIDLVYQSCDESYRKEWNEESLKAILKKYGLPSEYMLYVGTIEPRKNLLGILQAMKLLRSKANLPLVVIGRATTYKKKILDYLRNHSMEGSVYFLSHIPLAEMPAIYRKAQLFIYPSVFEGFGIPLIEALNCKVPVITSTGSCFSEAGGPASVYVTPGNVLELAEAIQHLLSQPALMDRMKQQGWDYVQRFNGDRTAADLAAVYKKLS